MLDGIGGGRVLHPEPVTISASGAVVTNRRRAFMGSSIDVCSGMFSNLPAGPRVNPSSLVDIAFFFHYRSVTQKSQSPNAIQPPATTIRTPLTMSAP